MPAFAYEALDSSGKKKTGVLEADTERQIRQQLRAQGLFPMSVEAADAEEKKASKRKGSLFQRGISTSELALITRQLATLISAALPIEQALYAVADQTEKPRVQKMLMAVRSRVVEGYSLADGMRDFPAIFDDLFCAMVAAGEKSGHLDEVLERLADYTEQRQKMKSEVVQASVYPAVLTLVAVAVVSFLLAVVVPEIVEQFSDLGAELPWVTQVLISISSALQNYGLYILAAIAIGLVVWGRMMKQKSFRYKVHSKYLYLPMIGNLVRGVNTARFARTLSILTASAIPLLDGMRITSQVMGNLRMREAVEKAADDLREGSSLKAALSKSKLFPPMMLHMIASGERSGELEQMLRRCADTQDNEFSNTVNVSLKIFEPLLIVSMAAVVLFIVLAIITPIMNLNQQIGM
ncbi:MULTISPECIES: type II secretion system inner membrane protein GspF [Gammaproteobacteria]|uniref:type II secretion system inner membrane protein GspF n=1 Tax=Gammaproteobacteria TaxID=1236 RepID=UPI000DD01328|nr:MULTISPECIES: type II secretion system inner membrane protein GspF [Gammaproteobacteria]RTE86203.1 type II secretion system protein GspF [Aliidiomarina sp. B3213]TCZ91555.1 type II secretion system protein GspF [Lysobacter sp. N42]